MTTQTATWLLSPEQVAERLSCGRSYVFQLLARGDIASVKVGRLRRVPETAVQDYIAALTAEQGGAGQ